MSILELAKETKALAEKATPGPERFMSLKGPAIAFGQGHDDILFQYAADADFYSHTRTAAPQLADAVLRLTAERDEMMEALKLYADSDCDVDGAGAKIGMGWVARELLTKLEEK